ncbi:M15 family metallopeptidase [Demequina phytophila]|uniref:M15 family metallopeptidase n=1 Tax=Demequina phytophila TaxID=1638981 RepID=UPI0007855DFC|nr:M15 family metallopeptidase [Demequina phytophila]
MTAAPPVARRRLAPAVLIAVGCFALGLGAGALSSAALADGDAAAEPTTSAAGEAVPRVTASGAPDVSAGEGTVPAVEVTTADIDGPGSITVVVNKVRPLQPEQYAPEDLVTVADVPGDATMREEAAAAMTALHAAADAEGAGFAISTAYRSHSAQANLYAAYAAEQGADAADRFSARAGYSEHQTGLAADIRADGCNLEPCFADTAAGRYVAEHAWEHGFVVRYPPDSEDVTGYIYEPWHLRYVGLETAAAMHESGIATLEEHFGLDPAPEYR